MTTLRVLAECYYRFLVLLAPVFVVGAVEPCAERIGAVEECLDERMENVSSGSELGERSMEGAYQEGRWDLTPERVVSWD